MLRADTTLLHTKYDTSYISFRVFKVTCYLCFVTVNIDLTFLSYLELDFCDIRVHDSITQ